MRKAKLFFLVFVPILVLSGTPLFSFNNRSQASEHIEIGSPCDFTGSYENWDYLNSHRYHQQNESGDYFHAVDLNSECRDATNNGPAYAPISGTVSKFIDQWGSYVVNIYGEGSYSGIRIMMVHFSSFTPTLNDGYVTIGERVGTIGATGTGVSGPHIHLEVYKNGVKQNYDQWRFWQMPNPLFQTMRGTDNKIYIRSSGNGVQWSPWESDGATYNDIATVQFKGETYQSARGLSGAVYVRSAENGIWSRWEHKGGYTKNDVSMQVFGSRLYQAVQGNSDTIYTRHTYDGVNWSEWRTGSDSILGWSEVAMAVSNTGSQNELFQAVRGTDNHVYYRKTNDGSFSTPWIKTTVKTNDDIDLEDFNGNLAIAVRGESNELIRGAYNDFSKTFVVVQDGLTSSSIDMEVFNNKLFITVRGQSGRINTKFVSDDSNSGWIQDGFEANAKPVLKSYNGRLYQAVRGTDNRVYTRSTSDGSNWTGWSSSTLTTLSEVSM